VIIRSSSSFVIRVATDDLRIGARPWADGYTLPGTRFDRFSSIVRFAADPVDPVSDVVHNQPVLFSDGSLREIGCRGGNHLVDD